MEETIAQKALRLLTPIPAGNFISGLYSNEKDKCCVIGHFIRLSSNNPNDYSIQNCSDIWVDSELRQSSTEFLKSQFTDRLFPFDIASVNNDYIIDLKSLHEKYPQEKRKDRVIACLKDMITAGY